MNTLKTVLQGSFLYNLLLKLSKAYEESYFKKIVDPFVVAFDNSSFFNALLGKREGEYYAHSKSYRLVKAKLKVIGWLVAILSKAFQRAYPSSLVVVLLKSVNEMEVKSPLKALSMLAIGFTVGYLIFEHGTFDIIGAVALISAGVLFMTADVSLMQLWKNSVVYRIYKYLLE